MCRKQHLIKCKEHVRTYNYHNDNLGANQMFLSVTKSNSDGLIFLKKILNSNQILKVFGSSWKQTVLYVLRTLSSFFHHIIGTPKDSFNSRYKENNNKAQPKGRLVSWTLHKTEKLALQHNVIRSLPNWVLGEGYSYICCMWVPEPRSWPLLFFECHMHKFVDCHSL